jgi:hypothetical protein
LLKAIGMSAFFAYLAIYLHIATINLPCYARPKVRAPHLFIKPPPKQEALQKNHTDTIYSHDSFTNPLFLVYTPGNLAFTHSVGKNFLACRYC